jgi:small subunit ribosomal protein S6
MEHYEILLLAIPEITEDEIKNLESQLQTMIRTAKSVFVSFDRWGKYHLAYPVNKNDYGVYFLVRFELLENSDAVLKEIKALVDVKFHDVIMRSMVTVLDPKQSLVYQRPTSLEEAPRREAGSFIHPSRHSESRSSDGIALDDDVEPDEIDDEDFERER